MLEKRVTVPENVTVEVTDHKLTVKGEKGELSRDFSDPRYDRFLSFQREGEEIVIKTTSQKRTVKSLVGTIAAHLKNMTQGVQKPYEYKMKIVYVHFPMTVEVKGDKIYIKNFLGEKGARTAKIIGDTQVKADKEFVTITSNCKEQAGQTASNIEQACRVKGRDKRVFQDGIYIIEKPKDK